MRSAAIWSFYNLQLIIWDELNVADDETMDVLITSHAGTGVDICFRWGKSLLFIALIQITIMNAIELKCTRFNDFERNAFLFR